MRPRTGEARPKEQSRRFRYRWLTKQWRVNIAAMSSAPRVKRGYALGQAGRAIVVAHPIKDIGHCSIPRRLQVVPQTYDRFPRATIRDKVDRV